MKNVDLLVDNMVTLKLNKLQHYNNNKTFQENANKLKVSVGTVWNWTHTDMTISAQKEHLSKWR